MICDAEDAFWQIPLHPREQRFYCAVLRRPDGAVNYLVYTRSVQGSRGAPLSWAVLLGLVCRCAFSTLRQSDGTAESQRLQVYIDDPALVIRGPRESRRHQVALLLLAWHVLGVSLAIKKGQLTNQFHESRPLRMVSDVLWNGHGCMSQNAPFELWVIQANRSDDKGSATCDGEQACHHHHRLPNRGLTTPSWVLTWTV